MTYKTEIALPQEFGDGRLDTILKVFATIRDPECQSLKLNWKNTTSILPAGFAIIACLVDYAIEYNCKLTSVFLKKKFKQIPVIQNLLNHNHKSALLPKSDWHSSFFTDWFLKGCGSTIDGSLVNQIINLFGHTLDSQVMFAAQLITNELMINSVDHSSSERYYYYAGLHDQELHLGVLDMGVSIPAKLNQKFDYEEDEVFLRQAMRKGITTRRIRSGGLGLYNIGLSLRSLDGRLTIVSRDAALRRYFKRGVTDCSTLKHSLNGSWCFARLPLDKGVQ